MKCRVSRHHRYLGGRRTRACLRHPPPLLPSQVILSPSSDKIVLDDYIVTTSNGSVEGIDLQLSFVIDGWKIGIPHNGNYSTLEDVWVMSI